VRFILSVALAASLGALVILIGGYEVGVAYSAMARGAFGSWDAVGATLNKAVPIGLAALGIALAYRAGLWNIGAEGQIYFGAFAATGAGLALPPDIPAWIAIPVILVAGIAAGGVWAALAALPRAYLGVNEILSTLLLNYVAILWVEYLVYGPWADPTTFSFPYSEPLPDPARMGSIAGNVHFGLVLLLGLGLLMAIVDRGMRWGYELRLSGDSPDAAVYGGISPRRLIISGLVLAGMAAGLAGAIEVSSSTGRLQAGLSPGYGFMAILVAWLAAGRAMPIVATAVLYAGLLNGAFSLQVAGVPPSIGTVLQAVLLIAVLAGIGSARYRLRVFRPTEVLT
jgi:ABC-type uncharacterized transport system permease subunit